MTRMNELRLALLQCESQPGDVSANLRRLDHVCAQAAAAGAHLLVTPEMFLTGYNIGALGVAGLAERAERASAAGGARRSRVAAVAAIARRHRIAIAFGHPERDDAGSIFNTAVCVDASGQRLGSYRKTHLFGDLDRSMFSAGSGDEPLFDLHGWHVGMLICYDVEFAENARRLALQGADLIVVPTANMTGFEFVAQHLIPTRAYENQVFVAYTNYCGNEGDLAYHGLSAVAAPDGRVLTRGGNEAGLLIADITLDALIAARRLLGHLEHCRRARL